jgi:hypothetical protein
MKSEEKNVDKLIAARIKKLAVEVVLFLKAACVGTVHFLSALSVLLDALGLLIA